MSSIDTQSGDVSPTVLVQRTCNATRTNNWSLFAIANTAACFLFGKFEKFKVWCEVGVGLACERETAHEFGRGGTTALCTPVFCKTLSAGAKPHESWCMFTRFLFVAARRLRFRNLHEASIDRYAHASRSMRRSMHEVP